MKRSIVIVILILSLLSISNQLFSKKTTELGEREIIEQMKTEFKLLIRIYNEHISILQQILANKIAKFRETKEGSVKHSKLKKEIESAKFEISEAKRQLAEFDDMIKNPERESELNSRNYDRLKALINTIKYSEFIYFGSGSTKITSSGMITLKEFKKYIENKKDFVIIVQGHADSTPLGPKLRKIYGDNEGLSLARAKEVRNYLVDDLGLSVRNIVLEGKSSKNPISTKKASNRRVELILKPKKI